MLRISKLTDYGTVVLACLAVRPGHRHTAAAVAERTGLGLPTVSKLLKSFHRAGIVTSTRGAHGGYQLARDSGSISLADVIQAIDGPLTVTACSVHSQRCGQFATCNVRDPLWKIRELILGALATCTVSEMATDEVRPGSLDRLTLAHASPPR